MKLSLEKTKIVDKNLLFFWQLSSFKYDEAGSKSWIPKIDPPLDAPESGLYSALQINPIQHIGKIVEHFF